MKQYLFLTCFMGLSCLAISQQLRVITELDGNVKENSGLIYLRGKLITHNDSGGEASLYEIDTLTGNVERIVEIKNATNVDWEDISFDEDYIYVGDFGNNSGTRRDLKIYRIDIEEYFDPSENIVNAEEIRFNYSDQMSYTPNQRTNYDAEALISYEDSLYIFTKNRGNLQCNIYSVPKSPGEYQISIKESFNPQGLITGASYNPEFDKIMLSGYFPTAFFVELKAFSNGSFVNGTIDRTPINPPSGFSRQIEGITFINEYSFFMSGERTNTEEETLYVLDLDPISTTNQADFDLISIFPNPVSGFLNVDYNKAFIAEFYDINGKQIMQSMQKSMDISSLQKGVYLIRIINSQGLLIGSQRIVVK